MVANITVARAFQALAAVHGYVDSTAYKQIYQELVGSFTGASLDALVTEFDADAAKVRSTDVELEHVDLFCLKRDFRYAQRSRRYLYERAQQEKLRHAYELWLLFARENSYYDLEGICDAGQGDPAALTGLKLADYQQMDFSI